MTEHEANRYMNDAIYHQLVDTLLAAFQSGHVKYYDAISALSVANELHWKAKSEQAYARRVRDHEGNRRGD